MSFSLSAVLMIASGSVHAVVNAIAKGGRVTQEVDAGGALMTVRASTDRASAAILLPAVLFVTGPADLGFGSGPALSCT